MELDPNYRTVFVINCGSVPYYFDDNIQCLAYCWYLTELSEGKKSYGKMGMSICWYKIQELKPFVFQEITDPLYHTWLAFFQSLQEIHFNWFLALDRFYFFNSIQEKSNTSFFEILRSTNFYKTA